MKTVEIFFWLFLFIIFYSYLGYGILLYIIIKIRRIFGIHKPFKGNENYEPEVTLFVAAYNEKDYVDEKIKNSFEMDYPQEDPGPNGCMDYIDCNGNDAYYLKEPCAEHD